MSEPFRLLSQVPPSVTESRPLPQPMDGITASTPTTSLASPPARPACQNDSDLQQPARSSEDISNTGSSSNRSWISALERPYQAPPASSVPTNPVRLYLSAYVTVSTLGTILTSSTFKRISKCRGSRMHHNLSQAMAPLLSLRRFQRR